MKKLGRYVVQCIKTNNNKFGFGYKHKEGQFISYIGKGVSDIEKAYIYDDLKHNSDGLDPSNECALEENARDDWKEYYKYVPVKIVIKGVEK